MAKKQLEMIQGGFNVTVKLGKNEYPAIDENNAFSILENKWNIYSRNCELTCKVITITDNATGKEKRRFIKTQNGSFDQAMPRGN